MVQSNIFSFSFKLFPRLDNKIIRVDWDVGIAEGREFGRGTNGG